mmetsp:Transcript_38825/g.71178  ORF Transcript_38825/g.71178 Transcript_38825/m.71178 type:complete len:90 (-) Transcript_38825:1071-1340(-)
MCARNSKRALVQSFDSLPHPMANACHRGLTDLTSKETSKNTQRILMAFSTKCRYVIVRRMASESLYPRAHKYTHVFAMINYIPGKISKG